ARRGEGAESAGDRRRPFGRRRNLCAERQCCEYPGRSAGGDQPRPTRRRDCPPGSARRSVSVRGISPGLTERLCEDVCVEEYPWFWWRPLPSALSPVAVRAPAPQG